MATLTHMITSSFIKSAKPRWTSELEKLDTPHRSLDEAYRLRKMRKKLMHAGIAEPDFTTGGLKRSPQFDYRKNLVVPFQFKNRNLIERLRMTNGIHQSLLTEQPELQRFLSETPNRSRKSTGMTLDRLLLRPKVQHKGGLEYAGYNTRNNLIRLPKHNSWMYPNDQILRHEMGHRNNAHFGSVARGHYDLSDRLLVKRVEDHTPGVIGRYATSPAIGQTLIEEATAEAMARYKTRDGRKVVPLPGSHLMRGKGAAKQTQDVVRHLQTNYMQNTYRPGAKGMLDRLAVAGRKLPFAIAGFKRGFRGL